MTDDNRDRGIAEAKRLIASGDFSAAYRILCNLGSANDDFTTLGSLSRMMSRIPLAQLGLKPIRVALVASSSVEHFAGILRYWLACEGFAPEIWMAPYDTVAATVLDRSSQLYAFAPDLVWFFATHRDVQLTEGGSVGEVAEAIERVRGYWQAIRSALPCAILQNNADIPAGDPWGNFAGGTPLGRRNRLRRYNLELAEAAEATTGVSVLDLDHLSSLYGKDRWIDRRYWYHSKNAMAFDALGLVAFQAARVIGAIKGRAHKCLALDLDNTLWGGVIGDDGLAGIVLGTGADGEAFVDFQQWLLTLKQRGILLVVCSKNEEANAQEPFVHHPDCRLRMGDFAMFRANWNPKPDNLREIAEVLNIGLDSIVFVDDNPVERDLMRAMLPSVAVPELPLDPSEYIGAIERHRYFETAGLSAEDRTRTELYRENMARIELRERFTDLSGYLQSLTMEAEAGDLDGFHLPRMAQLINKSNQFHLTGTRYNETELQHLAAQPGCVVRYFKLRDRLGDNGLIAVVVLMKDAEESLVVDTWVMSCRVLGRTMEEFIAGDIAAAARSLGCRAVKGTYVPSAKNGLVSDLYGRLGFSQAITEGKSTRWIYQLGNDEREFRTFVNPSSKHMDVA